MGVTNEGNDYIYKIEKYKCDVTGEQYKLTMQIAYEHSILNIDGYFTGVGLEGNREYSVRKNSNSLDIISNETANCSRDPYRKNNNKRYLMNISELSVYDKFCKDHPLSLCRSLVDHIIKTK